jgi:hypothetical protein
MLTAASLATIEAHWAAFLGCTVEELRGQDIVVPHHGRGIFILSRAGAVVAVPLGIAADRVVGPAFIGYLDEATFEARMQSRAFSTTAMPMRLKRCVQRASRSPGTMAAPRARWRPSGCSAAPRWRRSAATKSGASGSRTSASSRIRRIADVASEPRLSAR